MRRVRNALQARLIGGSQVIASQVAQKTTKYGGRRRDHKRLLGAGEVLGGQLPLMVAILFGDEDAEALLQPAAADHLAGLVVNSGPM